MDLRALRPSEPSVARDAELRRWRAALDDVTAIVDLAERHPGTCAGVVAAIRLVPGRSLRVTVEDGTGRLHALWAGRTSLPGLELGGALRLSGTVAVDVDGSRMMRNPAFTPLAEPFG
jgi:hypothetical protein